MAGSPAGLTESTIRRGSACLELVVRCGFLVISAIGRLVDLVAPRVLRFVAPRGPCAGCKPGWSRVREVSVDAVQFGEDPGQRTRSGSLQTDKKGGQGPGSLAESLLGDARVCPDGDAQVRSVLTQLDT